MWNLSQIHTFFCFCLFDNNTDYWNITTKHSLHPVWLLDRMSLLRTEFEVQKIILWLLWKYPVLFQSKWDVFEIRFLYQLLACFFFFFFRRSKKIYISLSFKPSSATFEGSLSFHKISCHSFQVVETENGFPIIASSYYFSTINLSDFFLSIRDEIFKIWVFFW